MTVSEVPVRYFFLSYAHTPPTPGVTTTDPEHWVNDFFQDLSAAVEDRANPTKRLAPGFCEAALPPGTDRNAALEEALAGAAVFVPLLAPRYFSNGWPQREIESFRRRLQGLDPRRAQRRIVPVLWITVPTWQWDDDVRRAVELGQNVPNYRQDGLRALLRLSPDREGYDEIVRRVADRIVEVAEGETLRPARPPVLIEDPPDRPLAEAPLVVSVVAPTAGEARAAGQAWRPFGAAQAVSPATAVVSVAERFSLTARVEDPARSTGVRYQYPTVLLVDPHVVATPDGESVLRRAIRDAPKWVTPLVLAEKSGVGEAADLEDLLALTKSILPAYGDNRARWAFNLTQFTKLTPEIVVAVYRHYLQRNVIEKESGGTER